MGRVGLLAAAGCTGVSMLALPASAWAGSSGNYDAVASRAAARADVKAKISPPARSDVPLGSPEMRFAFKLRDNVGQVSVYRSRVDAANALAQGKLIARAFGQSLDGDVFVVRNVVIGFDKTPTKPERAEVEHWLRTR
jgi:hypothetical protein